MLLISWFSHIFMRGMLQQSLTYRQQMNSNNPLKARRLSEGSCWNGGEALMWDEQDNRGGGREGRELCERECRALAVSRVICPLISLTVHSTNTFFLSLFRLSSPVPISFYYSLTISISLSSSKAALFWECSIRKRRESRWWFRRQGFGFSAWSESIKARDSDRLWEYSLLVFKTEVFLSL